MRRGFTVCRRFSFFERKRTAASMIPSTHLSTTQQRGRFSSLGKTPLHWGAHYEANGLALTRGTCYLACCLELAAEVTVLQWFGWCECNAVMFFIVKLKTHTAYCMYEAAFFIHLSTSIVIAAATLVAFSNKSSHCGVRTCFHYSIRRGSLSFTFTHLAEG